jgi:superfamily II DNA/RNA helicase
VRCLPQKNRPKETSGITNPPATTEKSFADLGVTERTIGSLARVGIQDPFPIQTLCLPLALSGGDLIGQARTGTGKTLAFGVPIAQAVASDVRAVQALVVVPTRELCLQVAGDIETAGRDAGIQAVPIVGGRPIGPQITALAKGAQVVVGTPGRLLDHLRQGTLNLKQVTIVVLDEADEMLDLGFLPDVETVLNHTPSERQTMLFSATMPKAVIALARRYMRQPTFVHAEPEEPDLVPATKQHFFQVHPLDRFEVLCRLLDTPARERVAVFRRTKRGVDRTIEGLRERGYNAGALHGDLPQHAREKVMAQFRTGKLDVMVATDVAARGLDIAGLSHVINYDTPEDDKAYLHRIGRTGRAGAAGVAITFVAWNEIDNADLIRRRLSLTDLPLEEVYSTSPKLVDLFGLPTAAEAAAKRGAGRSANGRRAKANGRSANGNGSKEPAASLAAANGETKERGSKPRNRRTVRRRRRSGFGPDQQQPAPQQATATASAGA